MKHLQEIGAFKMIFVTMALLSALATPLKVSAADLADLSEIANVDKVASDPMLLSAEVGIGSIKSEISFEFDSSGKNCIRSINVGSATGNSKGHVTHSVVEAQRCGLAAIQKELDEMAFAAGYWGGPNKARVIDSEQSKFANGQTKRTYSWTQDMVNWNCTETVSYHDWRSLSFSLLLSPFDTVTNGTTSNYNIYISRRLSKSDCMAFAQGYEKLQEIIKSVYEKHGL